MITLLGNQNLHFLAVSAAQIGLKMGMIHFLVYGMTFYIEY